DRPPRARGRLARTAADACRSATRRARPRANSTPPAPPCRSARPPRSRDSRAPPRTSLRSPRSWSLSVPPMPTRIIAQGAQEVCFAQIWPERFDEVDLAVCALPEHEIAQPLFARGPDHEIRVRLTASVQMLGDELGGEQLGELVQSLA